MVEDPKTTYDDAVTYALLAIQKAEQNLIIAKEKQVKAHQLWEKVNDLSKNDLEILQRIIRCKLGYDPDL